MTHPIESPMRWKTSFLDSRVDAYFLQIVRLLRAITSRRLHQLLELLSMNDNIDKNMFVFSF